MPARVHHAVLIWLTLYKMDRATGKRIYIRKFCGTGWCARNVVWICRRLPPKRYKKVSAAGEVKVSAGAVSKAKTYAYKRKVKKASLCLVSGKPAEQEKLNHPLMYCCTPCNSSFSLNCPHKLRNVHPFFRDKNDSFRLADKKNDEL